MAESSLEVGEKYLSCRIDRAKALDLVLEAIIKGESSVDFAVFKNKDKINNKQPAFVNKGIALWVRQKQEKKKEPNDYEAILEE